MAATFAHDGRSITPIEIDSLPSHVLPSIEGSTSPGDDDGSSEDVLSRRTGREFQELSQRPLGWVEHYQRELLSSPPPDQDFIPPGHKFTLDHPPNIHQLESLFVILQATDKYAHGWTWALDCFSDDYIFEVSSEVADVAAFFQRAIGDGDDRAKGYIKDINRICDVVLPKIGTSGHKIVGTLPKRPLTAVGQNTARLTQAKRAVDGVPAAKAMLDGNGDLQELLKAAAQWIDNTDIFDTLLDKFLSYFGDDVKYDARQ
jgi:hypothetical protein